MKREYQPIPSAEDKAFMKALPPNKARCHYCTRMTFADTVEQAFAADRECARRTRDHVVPASRGGTRMVICCDGCNTIKAATPASIFSYFVRQHRDEFTGMCASSRERLRVRYVEFVYQVSEAGFRAITALAMHHRGKSDLMREGISYPKRDQSGRFTKASLR